MTRRLVAVLLFAAAAVILVAVVPAARRERDDARSRYQAARAETGQLRVRLADLSRRSSEDPHPTAADGADAVRALRAAALAATAGLELSGVEIAASPSGRGAIAAKGRIAAEGGFVEALRLARRLASPSSGLLLERVTLGEARDQVRVEAQAFVLREAP